MPGAPHAPPPLFFHEVCERWARGVATSYDTAVLTTLTTDDPLPSNLDALAVGFDSLTRVPPPVTAHLFHDIKNDARVRFHRTAQANAHAALYASLTDALPSIASPFPSGLSAAPARLGLLSAASLAFGATRTVTWRAPFAAVCAAGPALCHAARHAGWTPIVDEEAGPMHTVLWSSGSHITDLQLASLVMQLSRFPDGNDVIPAGDAFFADTRDKTAVAALLPRLWLRARVAIGTRRRASISRIRKRAPRLSLHTLR